MKTSKLTMIPLITRLYINMMFLKYFVGFRLGERKALQQVDFLT